MLNKETSDGWAGEFSNVWRRLFAFLIDAFCLGVVGFLIELFCFERLVEIDEWGRVIGFVISVAYFGLMNSRPFGGQTLGKMAVGIGVVTRDGTCLTPLMSVVRAVIFCLPQSLEGFVFPSSSAETFVVSSIETFVIILLVGLSNLSNLMLVIFNQPSRQLLHDMVVGSIVVRAYAPNFSGVAWKGQLVIVAAVAIAAGQIPIATNSVYQRMAFFEFGKSISHEAGIRHTDVFLKTDGDSTKGDIEDKMVVTVTMNLISKDLNQEELANRVAQYVIDHFPKFLKETDLIVIEMVRGSDLVIIRAHTTYKNYRRSLSEWREEKLKSNKNEGTNAIHFYNSRAPIGYVHGIFYFSLPLNSDTGFYISLQRK